MGRPKWGSQTAKFDLEFPIIAVAQKTGRPFLASDPTRFAKFSSFHSPAKGVEGRVFPSSIVPVQAGMKQEPQVLSEPITSHYGPFMSLPLLLLDRSAPSSEGNPF
jgi:hypothetical protein